MTPAQMKAKRAKLGLSQTQLAKALDMSIRSISAMETGERKIPRVIALALDSLMSAKKGKGEAA